jgi:hypothetical protein
MGPSIQAVPKPDPSAIARGATHETAVQRILSAGPQGVMQTAGFLLILAAALAFCYGLYFLIRVDTPDRATGELSFVRDVLSPHFHIVMIVIIGVICAMFGVRLFSKAGSLTSQVIRPEDRDLLTPLIRSGNKEAIGEYIRLASLSGFSGTFTKLGFTGLPLVTVALTLILLAMALVIQDIEMRKGVFDLAKLMLGAFIGSFVQRNIEQEKLIGKAAAPEAPILVLPPAAGPTADAGASAAKPS